MNLQPSSAWAPDKEGCFLDLPAETYHRAPGMSHSMAKNMDPPACLPVYLSEERETTPDMLMGTLVHAAILEPEKPLPRLAIKPADMKFSTREGKAWRLEMLSQGLVIITENDFRSVDGMVSSIATDKDCRDVMATGHSEVSCFFRDRETGIMRKMRIDFLPGMPADFLLDIKTVQKGHAGRIFSKDFTDKRYWTQAAWYRDGWNQLNPDDIRQNFAFIAVEKEPPYLVNIHRVSQETLEIGTQRNAIDVETYAECKKSGIWPGYTDRFCEVSVNEWVKKDVIEKSHARWAKKVIESAQQETL